MRMENSLSLGQKDTAPFSWETTALPVDKVYLHDLFHCAYYVWIKEENKLQKKWKSNLKYSAFFLERPQLRKATNRLGKR